MRDRRVSNSLLHAIGSFIAAGANGELCPDARRILDSRVVFLWNTSSNVRRPIRISDPWQRVIAKPPVHTSKERITNLCLAHRQLAVSIPGGADALVHLRMAVEKFASEACLQPLSNSQASEQGMALVDVDFKKAFPSLEQPAILNAPSPRCPASF